MLLESDHLVLLTDWVAAVREVRRPRPGTAARTEARTRTAAMKNGILDTAAASHGRSPLWRTAKLSLKHFPDYQTPSDRARRIIPHGRTLEASGFRFRIFLRARGPRGVNRPRSPRGCQLPRSNLSTLSNCRLSRRRGDGFCRDSYLLRNSAYRARRCFQGHQATNFSPVSISTCSARR